MRLECQLASTVIPSGDWKQNKPTKTNQKTTANVCNKTNCGLDKCIIRGCPKRVQGAGGKCVVRSAWCVGNGDSAWLVNYKIFADKFIRQSINS